MKIFLLRLLSSLFLLPLFIISIFKLGYLYYFIIIFILLISFYEIYKNIRNKKISILLYFLILLFIYSFIKLRGSSIQEFFFIIWILSIVWLTDIFGYIVGKLIGGRKFSKYSPNKTIAGFIGSIFFSQFAVFIPKFLLNDFVINIKILLLQFALSLIAVLGDICFSYLKRINNIKDYSSIIPGHGGVLDRIDGMIFVIIICYFLNLLNVF